ncbi:MAG: hypothetical protein WC942_04620 [Clostridia bacterium]
MTVPQLEKDWIFKPREIFYAAQSATNSDQAASLLYYIKEALTNPNGWVDRDNNTVINNKPWVVKASSNGIVANTSDNWNGASSVIRGTSDFSWIVLNQPSISSNFSICFGTANGFYDTNYASQSFSFSATTGFDLLNLTTIDHPSSSDRITLCTISPTTFKNVNFFINRFNSTYNISVHIMMSTDGECTRIIAIDHDAETAQILLFDKPKNPIPEWNNPSIVLVSPIIIGQEGFSHGCLYSKLFSTAKFSSYINNSPASLFGSTEGLGSPIGLTLPKPNDFSGRFNISPIGLVSTGQFNSGYMGSLFDLYYTSAFLKVGDVFPETGDYRFVTIPNCLFPWLKTQPFIGGI